MANSFSITKDDSILLFAPHPDDESLGAGGLLQRAVEVGAKIHIVFVTNGDNNPWPQRVVERRVRISSHDRSRWGARRRSEARAALRKLGIPADAARFLGIPDRGVTALLMNNPEGPFGTLCHIFDETRPTILVVPSPNDHHPDHNSLYVLLRFVISRLGIPRPHELQYLIHGTEHAPEQTLLTIPLYSREKALKRDAILCHKSQMALSRRRFTAYAKTRETFALPAPPHKSANHHPVRVALIARGALQLSVRISATTRGIAGSRLLIAAQSLTEGSVRWSLALPSQSACVNICDETTGAILRRATVRFKRSAAHIKIPVSALLPLESVFIKFERPRLLFDRSGWREIPVQPSTATRRASSSAQLHRQTD